MDFAVGATDYRHGDNVRDSRRNRPTCRAYLLQYLSRQQESGQPDDGEGDANTDAERHIQSDGAASGTPCSHVARES